MTPPPHRTLSDRQLDELLQDPEFRKILDLVIAEVMRIWQVPYSVARGYALSAIGAPKTIGDIYNKWMIGRATGNLGLPKVMVRRRVIDLLRKESRNRRISDPDVTPTVNLTTYIPDDDDSGSLPDSVPSFRDYDETPEEEYAREQFVTQRLHLALAQFRALDKISDRQGYILQRALDGAGSAELAEELGTSPGAVRVRLHAARQAFGRFVLAHHPALAAAAR